MDMQATALTLDVSLPSTRPGSDLPDLEAIRAVIGGDTEMFAVIVRRYNPQLYRVGMAYLQDHARTEDAMQNSYLKAFLNLSRFRGRSSFGTWLTRIMINECLMILRRQKRIFMESLDDGTHERDVAAFAARAPEPLLGQEIKAALERAVQALPRMHRAVYLLRDVQQLSTAETAACLGITRENVKVLLHRAREGLKTEFLKSAAGVELYDYPAPYCEPMTARVLQAIRRLTTASPGGDPLARAGQQ